MDIHAEDPHAAVKEGSEFLKSPERQLGDG